MSDCVCVCVCVMCACVCACVHAVCVCVHVWLFNCDTGHSGLDVQFDTRVRPEEKKFARVGAAWCFTFFLKLLCFEFLIWFKIYTVFT